MYPKSRAIFLFLTIVAVMLASAVGTTSVYADDGTPPPSATETAAADPSTGEGEPTEAAPTSEPVVTEPEEAAPTSEPVVTEPTEAAPTSEPVVTEPTEAAPVEEAPVVEEPLPAETASILEQVPDNTTVTVLNAEGEAQPLSSQESAEAILTGDPIWCPNGQNPGSSDCTQSFASLDELLDFLDANEEDVNYRRPGTIYVEMGVYAGPESSIDFNAYDFQTLNQYDLTMQGGWQAPGVDIVPANPTQFDIPIIVGTTTNRWGGSLTFNNISISQVYNQTGLTLFSQGDIILSDVTITESQGGADLTAGGQVIVEDSKFNNNKKFGAKINAGSFVTISGKESQNPDEEPARTEFNNNGGNGLEIDSLSDVYLEWVSASNNAGNGADINTAGFGAAVNSVFNGNVSYTYVYCGHKKASGGYGIQIVGATIGYLEGVTANENYLFGAHVEAADVLVYSSTFDSNGSGTLSDPKGYGLEAISSGGATLDGVEANNNQKFGANIQATGYVEITNSFFNGNKSYKCSCDGTSYYGYGLQVVTDDDIVMRNVTATDNYLWGARLVGAEIAIREGVFSNNGNGTKTLTGKGLEVISTDEVSLRDVEANNNQLFGANIQAAGNVAIINGLFNGHKYTYSSKCGGSTTTGGYGLEIVTAGEIALSLVQANDNYLHGAQLQGSNVAISGDTANGINSLFNNNKSGLKINSTGEVALRAVEASNNKLFGADIEATGAVAVRDGFFNGNKSYTSTSCGHKTYKGYGLKVVTTSGVALRDVTADQNYEFGAYLKGTDVRVDDSSFSSNGTGTMSDHIGKGLEVVSTGSESVVTLSGVTASNNQIFGANVAAEGLVFVSNSIFKGNKSYTSTCYCKTYDGYGLQVVTNSAIKLDNVTANENYLWGASLKGANVTVNHSVFSFNSSPDDKNPTGKGLIVVSSGDVLLNYVDANDNQKFGADVQASGKVDVFSSVFARNIYYTYSSCQGTKSAGYGLKVVATGPITLGSAVDDADNRSQASENGAEGAILEGQSTIAVSNAKFNNNGADGLLIKAKDNVTLDNVEATGNKGDGVDVTGDCTHTVSVINGGTFANNSKYGIRLTNILYAPDGTQTFGGNGSGDVSQSGCATSTSSVSASQTSSETSSGSTSGRGWWHWWSWFRHH